MSDLGILNDEFAIAARQAGLRAREIALASGHPVVFVDAEGRYVEERPDGRWFQVQLRPGAGRESHLTVVGELEAPAQ